MRPTKKGRRHLILLTIKRGKFLCHCAKGQDLSATYERSSNVLFLCYALTKCYLKKEEEQTSVKESEQREMTLCITSFLSKK